MLLQQVESLLALQMPAERFMEAPASDLVLTALAEDHVSFSHSEAACPELNGVTIAHYTLAKKLGEGGMAIVYAARDERLQRPVAIKLLRPSTLEPEAAARLWREARTSAAINHPNICQIYEVGEQNGGVFIVMELLDGESLAQRIRRGPLSVAEAVQLALEVLTALGELHQRRLVHRDLKPSNVFLTPRGVKLLDFGLTRTADPPLTAFDG